MLAQGTLKLNSLPILVFINTAAENTTKARALHSGQTIAKLSLFRTLLLTDLTVIYDHSTHSIAGYTELECTRAKRPIYHGLESCSTRIFDF